MPSRNAMVAVALALVACATLLPGSGPGGGWDPARPGLADLLLNLALFLPLGLALRSDTRSRRRVLTMALSISFTIEVAQLLVVPGRTSSPWDMVANATGAWAGASLPFLFLAAPMALAWMVGPVLLAPAAPRTAQWWGQWAHQFANPKPFSGTIRQVSFQEIPIPDASLGQTLTSRLQSGYAAPPLPLSVTLVPPVSPSPDRHQIAGVADGTGGEAIGLWQLGWDLELRWHARGTAWGLRAPAIRGPILLQHTADSLIIISAWVEPGHAYVELSSSRRFGVRLGPWQGWRLFWPLPPPTPGQSAIISLAWTILGLGPLLLALAVRATIKGTNQPPTGPPRFPSSRT